MAICQIMIQDFLYGWGGYNDGYTNFDLEVGIQYCKDLMQFEKRKKEPFHGYDLKKFIKWAEAKIEEGEMEDYIFEEMSKEATASWIAGEDKDE